MSDWDDGPNPVSEDDFVYDEDDVDLAELDDDGAPEDSAIGPELIRQLAAAAFTHQHSSVLKQGSPAEFAALRLEAATKLLAAAEQIVRYRLAEVRAIPASRYQGGPERRVSRGEDPDRAPRLSRRWDDDDRAEQVGWRTVGEHWWEIGDTDRTFVRGNEQNGPTFWQRIWRRYENDPVVHQVQHNALVQVRNRFVDADQDNRLYPQWQKPGFPYPSDLERRGAAPSRRPVPTIGPEVEQGLLWDMYDV